MFPNRFRRSRPETPPPGEDAHTAQARPEADSSTRRALGLLALLELSDELAVQREPSAIGGTALLNLMGHYGCSRGALWLMPDGETCDPVLLRVQSVPADLAASIGRQWARWFRGRGSAAPDPVVVDRIARLDPVPPGTDLAQAADLAVIAPLTSHDRVIGLFALGRRVGGGDFRRMELEVLRASLNVIGVAVENARLRNRLAEARRELRLARDAMRELEREAPPGDVTIRLSRGDAKSMLGSLHEDRRPGLVAELRELELSVAADVPPALFDRECAGRILDAMVDDAARRAPCGSRIRLRLENVRDEEGGWVAAEVRDEGPGMGPEELAALLDAPDAGAGRPGLRTARRWAERMGGRLEAASEIGHGTVLTLRMPAA